MFQSRARECATCLRAAATTGKSFGTGNSNDTNTLCWVGMVGMGAYSPSATFAFRQSRHMDIYVRQRAHCCRPTQTSRRMDILCAWSLKLQLFLMISEPHWRQFASGVSFYTSALLLRALILAYAPFQTFGVLQKKYVRLPTVSCARGPWARYFYRHA